MNDDTAVPILQWLLGLCVPGLILFAVYDLLVRPLRARTQRGSDVFYGPAQLRLAQALLRCDLAQVKALLPEAGDLNKVYGDRTLLVMAIASGEQQPTENSADRLEIVRVMLAAGANPNFPPGQPLEAANSRGCEMAALLLAAGADPNAIGSGTEPFWWRWIWRDAVGTEQLEMVQLALAHGADVRRPGLVAYAASRDCWQTALLLKRSGADWSSTPV